MLTPNHPTTTNSITFLYRYLPLEPDNHKYLNRILDIINYHRLYASRPSDFNDPFDCRVKIEGDSLNRQSEIQTRVDERAGVICFCEDNNNILLWAHYSNKHYGICLEFNVNQWKSTRRINLEKVKYTMERPLITQDDLRRASSPRHSIPGSSFGPPQVDENDSLNFLRKMAFTKHKDWEYEKEWRIICSFSDPSNRSIPFPEEKVLTGVIFGLKTSNNDRHQILKAINNSRDPITPYRAIEDETSFIVKIVPFE